MKFANAVENMKEEIFAATGKLIAIPSVEGTPEPGAPFGKNVREALDATLKLGEELGFKVVNHEGYAGHIEFGEGEEIIAVLAHVDVVPEGSGWTKEPYKMTRVDGKLYGRGTSDDKGPAVAVIYALKSLKDAGVKFNRRVRIIIGCDEETGRWDCMKHYFEKEPMPLCGFTPDSDFPIINSEMGIIICSLEEKFEKNDTCDCDNGNICVREITGGNKANMVPDYCEARITVKKGGKETIEKVLEKYRAKEFGLTSEYCVKDEKYGEVCILEAIGVSAHGSTPEKGQNAISMILTVLNDLSLCQSDVADYIKFLGKNIGMELNGQSFGLGMEDDVSGKLILNLGVLKLNETEASATINIRYPVTNEEKEVYEILDKKSKMAGITVSRGASKAPLYVPADNFMVKTLQKVYTQVTGNEAKLISISGGTYARAIKNAVAFGPLFPDSVETYHQKDEYITESDLITAAKIYAEALYELVK